MSLPAPQDGFPCRNCQAWLASSARVCNACGELVQPTAGTASATATPTLPAGDLAPGELLEGTWRLEHEVGRGGMGTVFLATDTRLGRQVAVKALSVQMAGEEFINRFEREARVLGILDHPNIVTLHWVGRHRGVPFIVMRFLDGVPLRTWVDEQQGGRLSPKELVPVAQQACSALAYIHAKGVVHRDLKPSNIMVGPQGQVTVFDLGIARPNESNLTKTGIIFGTPGYMAPELIVGEKNLDGRLDLYALGVILYELCTGRSPFEDDRGEESLLRAHLMKPRPDASLVCADVPPALGAVLQKAMALDPKHRYPDADEMLAALETAVGVRRFHEAATIRRAALSPTGPREPVTEAAGPVASSPPPDLTPKMLQPLAPHGAASPGPGLTRPIRRPTGPAHEPFTAPLSEVVEPPDETLPPGGNDTLVSLVPTAPHPAPAPARPARPSGQRPQDKSTSRFSAQALRSSSSAAVPRAQAPASWTEDAAIWRRRPVQVGVAVLALALLAAVVAGLTLFPEKPPEGPRPLPRVVGREAPPPPPDKPPDDPAAHAEALARSGRTVPAAGSGQASAARTERVRTQVRPRVRRQTAQFQAARGYGELQLDVMVNGEPVAANVRLNGEDYGPSPLLIPVKAGSHHVRVQHPPFPTSVFTTAVVAGRSVKLEIELQPYEDAPPDAEVQQKFEEG